MDVSIFVTISSRMDKFIDIVIDKFIDIVINLCY